MGITASGSFETSLPKTANGDTTIKDRIPAQDINCLKMLHTLTFIFDLSKITVKSLIVYTKK